MNVAEHHDYIVVFDRQGNYKKKLQIEDAFALHRVAGFRSGTLLAYGFDRRDHSPKLAMLRDDGNLLRYLDIPKGDVPTSMLRTLDGTGKGPAVYVAPAQFVRRGESIIIVQNRTKFPLLEVTEAGAIRAIKPKLPDGAQIDEVIPSDESLYVRVAGPSRDGSVYELSQKSGVPLKHFQIGSGESGVELACVHDGRFLSFVQDGGTLVRLSVTAEPAIDPIATDPKR